MKPAVAALVAVNLALAGAVGYLFYSRSPGASPPGSPGRNAELPVSSAPISALGRVQPAGGVVGVNGVPGDRVVEVKVTLGQEVQSGDVLVTLSGEPERALAIKTLEAQLAEAQAVKAAAQKSTQARKAELDAEVAQAEAKAASDRAPLDAKAKVIAIQRRRATDELARLERAKSLGASVSDSDLGAARSLVAQADAENEAITIQEKRADELLAAAKTAAEQKRIAGEAEAERVIAQVPVESLKAAIAAAKQKAEAGTVRAPINGRVVDLDARRGTAVGMTPLVQLADTSNMVVVAEVYESDVPRLREQLKRGPVAAMVFATPLPGNDQLRGSVTGPSQVAPMVARNAVFALGPREDADRRVLEVTVTLDAGSAQRVRDFIGLQVTIEFTADAAK